MIGKPLTLFHLERIVEPLALSGEQYQALRTLFLESGRRLVRTLDEIQAYEFRLYAARRWSRRHMARLTAGLEAAKADFLWMRLETGSKAYSLLSPEQQRSFRKLTCGPKSESLP